jgi:hypothetical protein
LADDSSNSNKAGGRPGDDRTQEDCEEEEEEECEEEEEEEDDGDDVTPRRTKKAEKSDSVVFAGSYTQISQHDRELEEVSRIRTAGKYIYRFILLSFLSFSGYVNIGSPIRRVEF